MIAALVVSKAPDKSEIKSDVETIIWHIFYKKTGIWKSITVYRHIVARERGEVSLLRSLFRLSQGFSTNYKLLHFFLFRCHDAMPSQNMTGLFRQLLLDKCSFRLHHI